MRIQVECAPEFHSDFWQKKIFLFFKKNFKRNIHCKFIHHKSYLKPFLSYLPCIVCREYFSIIFNVKKCTLNLIKYGNWSLTIASGGSTVVQHSLHHSKVKGLSPTTSADNGREKMAKQTKKWWYLSWYELFSVKREEMKWIVTEYWRF
jgi:hypothetical protein